MQALDILDKKWYSCCLLTRTSSRLRMKSAYQQQHSRQFDAILAALPKDADETLRRFVQQFYARASLDDLEHYGPAHAVALATSAFSFMQERPPGKPKIRIFTPQKREHGYDSKNI